MENKECCKWCEHCLITNLEKGFGVCYLDIGEHVELSMEACVAYRYDEDLDRC